MVFLLGVINLVMVDLKSMNKNIITLLWNDKALTVINSNSKIENALQYTHKSLEYDEYSKRRKVKYTKTNTFIENSIAIAGLRTIVTYQGFLNDVLNICIKENFKFKFFDNRSYFPKPELNRMSGFIHSQKELLTEFLNKNKSGIFCAPTRWGKSRIIINAIKAFPNLQTVVTAPGVDLLEQLRQELTEHLPNREIKGIYSGSKGKKQSDDVTLVSMDSLHYCNFETTKLLLCDEPHTAVTSGRVPQINKFENARRLAFGATPDGRFDNSDCLIKGTFGPVLVERTYKEAVKEGAILQIKVFMIKIKFEPFNIKTRDSAYNRLLLKNQDINNLIKNISENVIPKDWQTLIFIKNEKQAEAMSQTIPESKIGMAKKVNKKERNELFQEIKENKLTRCVCSNIYSTGVTFPDLRCIVNCEGGGGSISSTQKPGRLAQKRPNKNFGYLFDLYFEPNDNNITKTSHPKNMNQWWSLVDDSKNRLKTYQNKGYDVEFVDNLNEINLV